MKLPIETIESVINEHKKKNCFIKNVPNNGYEILDFNLTQIVDFANAISEAAIKEVQDSNEAVGIRVRYSNDPYRWFYYGKGDTFNADCVELQDVYTVPPNNSEVDELKAKLDEVNQNFDMAHTTLKVAVQALAWADGHLDDVLLKKTIANVQKTFEALAAIGGK